MEQNNPFAADPQAFEEGLRLFKAGRLGDAVLAFQSVVSQEVRGCCLSSFFRKTLRI
jgi:hypothetical protein